MAKLSLTAAPTFTATVQIPIPGKRPAPVEFKFKHRNKDELEVFFRDFSGTDVELVMEIVSGWDLDDPFSAETVAQLLNSYSGAGKAISDKYLSEMIQARVGN